MSDQGRLDLNSPVLVVSAEAMDRTREAAIREWQVVMAKWSQTEG